MARILVSGATGFIGTPLVSLLSSLNHQVVLLIRAQDPKTPNSIVWDPEAQKAKSQDFENFDAVIHLAGEPLTLARWSKEKRDKILKSRSEGTRFLTELLSSVNSRPRLFLSASAMGYYGDRGEEILTEESSNGNGFLAHVCAEWEKASSPLKSKGVRVVHTRFGMVLGPDGGALEKMAAPFRFGLGGRLGSGKQWMSWIHRDDLIEAIALILKDQTLEGAVNVVSPNPVRQEEFAKTLAEILHRPCFFHIPAWALKLRFQTAAEELILASARVHCKKLLAANLVFKYPCLRSALFGALKENL